jgi:hypothetical protein
MSERGELANRALVRSHKHFPQDLYSLLENSTGKGFNEPVSTI